MPRFVILRHDCPRGVHFDFMLESDGVLKTWALPEPPSQGVSFIGESLPDHRLAYLDYEGPVSDNRGSVARWDHGAYETEQRTDTEWNVALSGEKIVGKVILRKTADSANLWSVEMGAADQGTLTAY
jgi:hypothetical protein